MFSIMHKERHDTQHYLFLFLFCYQTKSSSSNGVIDVNFCILNYQTKSKDLVQQQALLVHNL